MNDIDFAPTTNGGRVRLSSIIRAERPEVIDDEVSVFVVSDKGTVAFIGPFSSEKAASQWLDANLPMRELP